MDVLISIDPGINYTGIAYYAYGSLYDTKLISRFAKARLELNMENQVFELLQWLGLCAMVDHVVCEYPRIYPKQPFRQNDQVDLAMMAAALVTGVKLNNAGCSTEFVTARSWRGQTPDDIHASRLLRDIPNLSQMVARYPKTQQEHIIDAAGIGRWKLDREYN